MPRPRKPWQPKPSPISRPVRRVAGYVRVSTGDQAAEGFGLDAQRDAIAAYCHAAGYELAEIAGDEGVSGTLGPEARPGLARLLAVAESGDIDAVVVKALDRIGRRPAVAAAVFDTLDAASVRFLSITEPELSSDLLRGLFAGIASDERRRILERTAAGRVAKASRGGYAGGRVPYGYRLEGTRREARWRVEPTEAATVRRVFARRAAGATFAAIAGELTAAGAPPPGHGVRWSTATVYGIAHNPAYAGLRRWREGREIVAPGAWEAIVDEATFPGDATAA